MIHFRPVMINYQLPVRFSNSNPSNNKVENKTSQPIEDRVRNLETK